MSDPALDEPKDYEQLVSAWIDALEGAGTEEKDWRNSADRASQSYRGEGEGASRFNIYHANVETIVPALYNSTPVPDIRTRFNQDDPTAKFVGDLLERAISFSVDDYDFDDVMLPCVWDMVTASRGVARIRYLPKFGPPSEAFPKGELVDQSVISEYVPWRSFRRSPGRLWSDVTWIAFEHYLSEAEVERLVVQSDLPLDPDKLDKPLKEIIPFTHSASVKGENDDKRETPRFSGRAHVWEIWDKDRGEVLLVCPEYGRRPLFVQPDPLGLAGFFPIPMPMRGLRTTDSLVPVTSISVYQNLLDELNEVTARITRLVKQLRPRGGYATQFADLERIAEADDGQLVGLQGIESALSSGGDINKLIAWFPMEPTIRALAELREQREAIKQTIYEVTGLSDIVRGASNPNETLGAQQLKTQWGSLRIQRMQSEVARFARDLFRMKAEVMAKHFSMDTLLMMTGLEAPLVQVRDAARQRIMAAQALPMGPMGQPMPPQPPSPQDVKLAEMPAREEVEQILRQDAMRAYRIDIESDSTIRGDLSRNQEQMVGFVQGAGGYFQSVGPAVQTGAMPKEVAIEIFAAFARTFKLGKQAEDALDAWADQAKQASSQPQGGQPNPEAERIQGQLAVTEASAKADQGKVQGQAQIIQLKDQVADKDFQRTMALKDREDQSMAFRAQFGPVATQDVGQQ